MRIWFSMVGVWVMVSGGMNLSVTSLFDLWIIPLILVICSLILCLNTSVLRMLRYDFDVMGFWLLFIGSWCFPKIPFDTLPMVLFCVVIYECVFPS